MDPETPLKRPWARWPAPCGRGKALYAGLSNYDGEMAARAAALLEAGAALCGVPKPLFHAGPHRRAQWPAGLCARGGQGVVAFSPLAQGLLSGRYLHGIPQGSRIARGNSVRMTPQALTPALMGLKTGRAGVAARGQTLAQFAFVGAFGAGVTSVLVAPQRGTVARKTLPALRPRRFRRKSEAAAAPWAEAVCKTCRFLRKTLSQV